MTVAIYSLTLLLTVGFAVAELEIFRSHCLRTGMFRAAEKGKYTCHFSSVTLR